MGACISWVSTLGTDTQSLVDTRDGERQIDVESRRVMKIAQKNIQFLIPDNATEINRLDLQHYAIQHICRKRYFAPLEEPRRIIDIGCGTGTWMLEMATEFPECNFLGIDVAALPSDTELSSNCSFERGNVLDGIRKPDNWFDLVHQRILISGIPLDAWQSHIDECTRICTPGGWVEIIELDGQLIGGGPACEQSNIWIREGLKARGIDVTVAERLDTLMHRSGLVNISKQTYVLPFGNWGGKAGELLAEDFRLACESLKVLFTNTLDVTLEEVNANTAKVLDELKASRAHVKLYVYLGQKR